MPWSSEEGYGTHPHATTVPFICLQRPILLPRAACEVWVLRLGQFSVLPSFLAPDERLVMPEL